MRSAPALAFEYRPSRPAGIVAGLAVLLALLAPWLSALPAGAAALTSVLLAIPAVATLLRHFLPNWCTISHGEAGWALRDRDGQEVPAQLLGSVHAGPLLTLSLRPSGRRPFHALFAWGNIDPQVRRELILLLARTRIEQARPETG